MRMKILILILAVCSIQLSAQGRMMPGRRSPGASADIDLIPGMKMPEISVEWVKKPKEKTAGPGQKRIVITAFVDMLSPDIFQTLRLMESLEKRYDSAPGAAVTVRTVAKNTPELIKRILESDTAPFTAAIGADIQGRTFRKFNTALSALPAAFIAKDGAIAWNGHPIEIESVVDAILEGNYSASRQKTIAGLRKDLQSALRSGLPDVIAQTADKILDLSPNDAIAMQARLYSFELKGQAAKEVDFLMNHIRKNPKNAMRNRLLLLNLLLRTGNMPQWRGCVADTAREAEKNPDDVMNLMQFLLDRSPLGELPVELLRTLPEKALSELRKSGRADSLADALELCARIKYALCRPREAIVLQEEAAALRKQQKSPLLPRSEAILRFYRDLK